MLNVGPGELGLLAVMALGPVVWLVVRVMSWLVEHDGRGGDGKRWTR